MSQVIRLILLALLVVALAVLLSLGAAVGSSRPATRSIARLLPDQLPVDLPNGVVDTPLGQGPLGAPDRGPDHPSRPAAAERRALGSHLVRRRAAPATCRAREPDGDRRCETDVPPRLWTSNDAVSARVEHQLPVDAASAGTVPRRRHVLAHDGPT